MIDPFQEFVLKTVCTRNCHYLFTISISETLYTVYIKHQALTWCRLWKNDGSFLRIYMLKTVFYCYSLFTFSISEALYTVSFKHQLLTWRLL